jgi:hypothetical protein
VAREEGSLIEFANFCLNFLMPFAKRPFALAELLRPVIGKGAIYSHPRPSPAHADFWIDAVAVVPQLLSQPTVCEARKPHSRALPDDIENEAARWRLNVSGRQERLLSSFSNLEAHNLDLPRAPSKLGGSDHKTVAGQTIEKRRGKAVREQDCFTAAIGRTGEDRKRPEAVNTGAGF